MPSLGAFLCVVCTHLTHSCVLSAVNAKTEGKRTDEFNHFKALAEASQALTWVAFQPGSGMPLPGTQVDEAWSSAEFWTNKVLTQYRGKDDRHVAWVTALKDLFTGLRGYVKQHHAAGPAWNARGVDVADFNAAAATTAPVARTASSGGPPPPPPGGPGSLIRDAAPSTSAPSAKPGGPNMNALFSEINRGEGVSSGLRKVTDDMKTKNRADRSGAVPAADSKPSAAGSGGVAPKAGSGGPAKVACEGGRKWVVENQTNAGQVTVSEVNPKQTVYIYNCSNTVVHVTGKINSLCVDKCNRTSVLLTDVVAACEVVNSSSTQVQVTGCAPTVAIDNCAGVQLYLSTASLGCSITTCKSTEVNVLIPGANAEDDMRETPIPEQFVTTFVDGKWVTTTMEHSAG